VELAYDVLGPSVVHHERWTRRLVADPEAVAASLRDPARRDEVQRIVARLAQQGQERPDDAESVRPKHGDREIWHVAVQNSYLK
jgi:cytochrome c-type biogenesis protein CcmH/NrfG